MVFRTVYGDMQACGFALDDVLDDNWPWKPASNLAGLRVCMSRSSAIVGRKYAYLGLIEGCLHGIEG